MANSDVDNTVKKVENTDHAKDGGAEKAYKELITDFQEYQKTHTADEAKSYWKGVTDQLTKDNVLPDLALAWGKENLAAADISGDGKLNKAELSQFKRYDQNVPENYADTTFANVLADNKTTHDVTGKDDGQYTNDNLDDKLKDQAENNKKLDEQLHARDDMGPLFQGTPPLFQTLDGAAAGGHKLDGHVSRDDMEEWIAEYNRFTNNGTLKAPDGSPFTAENAKFINNVLDGNNATLDKDGFKTEDLSEKAGLDKTKADNDDKYKDLAAKFNDKAKADHPTDTTATTTSPTDGTPPTTSDQPTTPTDQPTSPTDGTPPPTDNSKIPQDQQQNIIDQLAKNPSAIGVITDGNGNVDKAKLDALLKAGDPSTITDPDGKAAYDALKSLSDNFEKLGGKDGKLNLDELTKSAFKQGDNDVTDRHFSDRLKAANNYTLTDDEKTKLVDYLQKNPDFAKSLVDANGNITKEGLKNYLQSVVGVPGGIDADQITAVNDLYSAYNTLSKDGGSSLKLDDIGVKLPDSVQPADHTTPQGADNNYDLTKDYTVQSGDGFDHIANQVIRDQLGRDPENAQETLALSNLIAAANHNDRQYSQGQIHPGNQLVVPDLAAIVKDAEAAGMPLIDYLNKATEALAAADQQAGSDAVVATPPVAVAA